MRIRQRSLAYEPLGVTAEQPIQTMRRAHVMDDGEIESLHAHNCMEFGCCDKGSGVFIINDRIVPFRRGDVTIMARGDYHKATSSPGVVSAWRWIWADVESCIKGSGSFEPGSEHAPLLDLRLRSSVLHDEPALFSTLNEILMEMKAKTEHYKTAVQALMLWLTVQLHRRFGDSRSSVSPASKHGDAVQPAPDHIFAGYSSAIRIETLAELCHTSLSSFRTNFKAATGMTPVTYINTLRLRMSETLLLDTDRPILDIALDTGFQTLSSYNRLFKRARACSPREYRKRHSPPAAD